ncbi:MAG: response regulator [Oscillospiraceae bacterium]|nr:response regulator [Oscillospiraceae bacterium]
MNGQRLLIAESNEELRLALARELQTFHYVRCCSTGMEALELIRNEQPDLLVLSMSLPELDGLTLLETIAAENIRPMVLALTSYRSDYLEASAYRLGVAYILLKPASLETIVHRVLDMKQHLKSLPAKPTPEQILETLLKPLGLHPQLQSYLYLQTAIILMAADLPSPLCKRIYLDTARRCGATYHAVESAIRHTVETFWDPNTWKIYFPDTARHPTAKVFLIKMAHLFREAME